MELSLRWTFTPPSGRRGNTNLTPTLIHCLVIVRNLLLCGSMDRLAFLVDLDRPDDPVVQRFEDHSKWVTPWWHHPLNDPSFEGTLSVFSGLRLESTLSLDHMITPFLFTGKCCYQIDRHLYFWLTYISTHSARQDSDGLYEQVKTIKFGGAVEGMDFAKVTEREGII